MCIIIQRIIKNYKIKPVDVYLVRSFAGYQIKPHVPPLVKAPADSFKFQPCGFTSQAGHLTR